MRKNNVKNGVALTMAAVMGLSICAGCGSTTGSEEPAAETEVSVEQTEEATEEESAEDQTEDAATESTEATEEGSTEEQEATEDEMAFPTPEYIEDKVISTSLMTVTVPDEFEGAFYAAVDGEMVSIYDKSCVDDGFGGFVFAVAADKDKNLIPGGMYTKVGEITDTEGAVCDVCVGYPSEIQWDWNNPDDEPETYKKLEDARDAIIENIKGTDGCVFAYQAGTRGEDLYGDVLAKYAQALNDGWDANKFEQEGMSPEFYALTQTEGDKAADKIGFIYEDVTNDGIDELLLGVIDDADPSVVYDVYTVVDKVPTLVVSGTARNGYYAMEYGGIANFFFNGADENGVYSYIIYPNSTELGFQYGLKYDGYTDEANPWFITYSDENSWEPMTEEEYNDRLDVMKGDFKKLDFTPLSNVTE